MRQPVSQCFPQAATTPTDALNVRYVRLRRAAEAMLQQVKNAALDRSPVLSRLPQGPRTSPFLSVSPYLSLPLSCSRLSLLSVCVGKAGRERGKGWWWL
jgi:hypothetical protein